MSAAITAAVVGAGAAVYSASQSGKAAGAQADAANQANQTQRQQYQQTRTDLSGYRNTGNAANAQLAGLYGLPGSTPVDPTQTLENTPGYQFQFDQGQEAVQRNLAARGLLDSGAAGKALTQYGQNYAQGAYQQYVQNLQAQAGLGENAAAQTGNAGAMAANQISGNQIYSGNAQAAGYANQANAIGSGINGLAGIAGQYAQPAYSAYANNWASGAINDVSQAGYAGAGRYMMSTGLT